MVLLHLIDRQNIAASGGLPNHYPTSSMLKQCLIELRHVKTRLQRIMKHDNQEEALRSDYDDSLKSTFFGLIHDRLDQIIVSS